MSTLLLRQSAVAWEPRNYQITAVKWLLEHACAALFLKPGLGKTSTTLAALTILKNKGMFGKTLIIAPLRPCYSVWPNEIQKWLDFSHFSYEIAHDDNFEHALKADVDIVLINPEGLDKMLGVEKTDVPTRVKDRVTGALVDTTRRSIEVNKKKFKAYGFKNLVVDELSKFKHHSTDRFKAFKQVLDTFDRRWGLTGSPSANGLLDLFGQCYILDMGNALGPYITHYRNTYFDSDRYQYKWTLRPGADKLIYEKIADLALQMGYEHLDMPELVENNIYIDLPDNVMDLYLRMEKSYVLQLEKGFSSALTAAAASTKIRQIASGGIYIDPEVLANGLRKPKAEREWQHLHTKKVEALREFTDELQGDPVLVAYDFEHDLERLRHGFKDGEFADDYNMKEFSALEARWNRGEVPILFGHPASIGHGLNLQGSSQNVCWHTPTWNREHYDQFIDRVWRQGNKHDRVFVTRIVARNTIDEVMLGALNFKGSVEEALYQGLKELQETRCL